MNVSKSPKENKNLNEENDWLFYNFPSNFFVKTNNVDFVEFSLEKSNSLEESKDNETESKNIQFLNDDVMKMINSPIVKSLYLF